MNQMLKISTILGFAVAVGLSAAPSTFAKGHNQGATGEPGVSVGETVGASQTEGAEQGNGKTAAEASGQATPGNSENAGRSTGDSGGNGKNAK